MTKVALQKYQNYFEEQQFFRGKIVQKEGEPMELLHLILEGEFELSK